jgi:hypothetical protein
MSEQKALTKGHTDRLAPLNAVQLRNDLLDAAGFDHTQQVEIMKAVIESAVDGLDAEKETPGWAFGKLVDVHKQPDHSARAKAREQLIDLLGASGKQTEQRQAPVKVEIPLPPWANLTIRANKPVQTPVTVEASQVREIPSVLDERETNP